MVGSTWTERIVKLIHQNGNTAKSVQKNWVLNLINKNLMTPNQKNRRLMKKTFKNAPKYQGKIAILKR